MKIKEILLRAAEIVEAGWAKYWYAGKYEQDKTVKKEKLIFVPLTSRNPEATHFCMLGGIHKALREVNPEFTKEDRDTVLEPLEVFLKERFKDKLNPPYGLGLFNDTLNSGEEAGAILREAAERL